MRFEGTEGMFNFVKMLDIPEHADPTRSSEITGEDRVIYNNDFLTIRRMLTPNL